MAQAPQAKIVDCTVFELPKKTDPRGNLTFVESGKHVPFEFKRVFYIYDIPTGESRGAHAHKDQHQFLVCLAGGYKVSLDDGKQKSTIELKVPWKGLHIPPGIWAAEVEFNPGSIVLVFASDFYTETDYIREYNDFLKFKT